MRWVARVRAVRIWVKIRQFLRWAEPCSTGREDSVGGLLTGGELVGAAGGETGDDHGCPGRGAEFRLAPRPAARRRAKRWSWRAAVLSWVRPGRAADIQVSRPHLSVRARKCRP